MDPAYAHMLHHTLLQMQAPVSFDSWLQLLQLLQLSVSGPRLCRAALQLAL